MQAISNLSALPPPIREDERGVLRVGNTRITLTTVLTAFLAGYSVEEIVLKYPTLSLAEVYSVIAYYLWNKEVLDDYLHKAEEEAQQRRETFRNNLKNFDATLV